MVDKSSIKTALRISHNRLDSEIERVIGTACSELIRVGCSSSIVRGDNPLIDEAIITYALYKFAPADNERFLQSFLYQADNLRKSGATKNEE